MLQRAIGVTLVLLGVFQAALSAKNLWRIHRAWHESGAWGIEFGGTPVPAENLRNLWNENLAMLTVMLFAIAIGVVLVTIKERNA